MFFYFFYFCQIWQVQMYCRCIWNLSGEHCPVYCFFPCLQSWILGYIKVTFFFFFFIFFLLYFSFFVILFQIFCLKLGLSCITNFFLLKEDKEKECIIFICKFKLTKRALAQAMAQDNYCWKPAIYNNLVHSLFCPFHHKGCLRNGPTALSMQQGLFAKGSIAHHLCLDQWVCFMRCCHGAG